MYKIIDPGKEFTIYNKTYKPIVTLTDEQDIYHITIEEERYLIFKNAPYRSDTNQPWELMKCDFDKYFVEVLRLLPENPNDLAILNQDYYKQMLELWQSEENFSLDKNLLEFEALTLEIEKEMNEKKGD
jgi:hypothetical protein